MAWLPRTTVCLHEEALYTEDEPYPSQQLRDTIEKSASGGKGTFPGTKVALSVPVPSACTRNVHVSETESQLCPPALMVNVIAHASCRAKVSKPTTAKGVGGALGVGNVPVAANAHVPRILLLNWLRVFTSVNTAHLGHRGGQER